MYNYDTIIIGLGAMGSAAAYQLAKKGKKVLGIDQFSPPHTEGSSHGDTRIIRQAIGEGEQYVPLVLRAYELWQEIEKESGQDLLTITGGLFMASDNKEKPNVFIQQTIDSAKKYNIEHEVLNAQEIAARFPQFKLKGDEVGYYEPMTGFLRPERCVEAQLSLAKKYGATINTNERVLKFESDNNQVTVTTDKGIYQADKLIVSAGPWITKLLPEFASLFTIYRQVLYWFDVKDSVEPYLKAKFPIFIWEFGADHQDFIYGFPAIDGLQGGVKVASEETIAADPDKVDRTISQEEAQRIYNQYIADHLPGLSDHCLRAVSCLYTSTPDNDFVIDTHPEHSNIIIASPCSGHGFKHSAAIGEVLAELATEGKSKLDISPFNIKRFKTI